MHWLDEWINEYLQNDWMMNRWKITGWMQASR